MKKIGSSAIIVLLITTGIFAWLGLRSEQKEPLPLPVVYQDEKKEEDVTTPPNPVTPSPTKVKENTLPLELNLSVPFMSQAPHKKWDPPYKEFCEEASIIMAEHYLRTKPIPSADYADTELQRLWKREQAMGLGEDTDVADTARVLKDVYEIADVTIIKNPTVDNIKRALADKKVVIMPAAGRQLGNPYFRQPGPLYHMLVIKGYTKDDEFITNDPGTKNGKDYLYSFDRIMNAIHDWNDGRVESGQKAIIVVG